MDQCVLRQDNDWWGPNVYELPLDRVTGAWLSRDTILALDEDGVLWGFGGNLHGKLWDMPEDGAWTSPAKLTDHVVSAIISAWNFAAVVKDDGGVWLMGRPYNHFGAEPLPPTRIAEVKDAVEIYAAPYIYVRDKDGVSHRLGMVDELFKDPTALMSEQFSGGKWLREDLWLTDGGELVRVLPSGEEKTLLTGVDDVDLSYEVFTTAVTKGGELYVWNEEEPTGYEGLSVQTPTKVMEGVKLAGASEHGVVVVTETDGAVWLIYRDTLEAAIARGQLIELPPAPPTTEERDDWEEERRKEDESATVEGFYHRPFEELPQALRDSLKWDGEIQTEEGYHFRLRNYVGPNIVVTTTEVFDEVLQKWLDGELNNEERERTEEDLRAEYELERGREWLYSVTITDDSYATLWGLKVGDTVEEAEALGYPLRERLNANGTASFGTWEHAIEVHVEDNVVERLRLYWGLGRYTGKYWDL